MGIAVRIDILWQRILRIHCASCEVDVFPFVHIRQAHRVADLGPMRIRIRIVVIVHAVGCSNGVARRIVEGAEVTVDNGELIEARLFHAIDLRAGGDEAVVVFQAAVDDVVNRCIDVIDTAHRQPALIDRAELVFGDELLNAGGLSVGAAARCDATSRFDGGDVVFRKRPIRIEPLTSERLEIAGVGHLKIGGEIAAHVFVHVESAHKGHDELEEHHGQRQRDDGDDRLAAVAAEIGPGHGEKGDLFFLAAALCAAAGLGVTQRFNRRHTPSHATGAETGDEYGYQRKERRTCKDPRTCRSHRLHAVKLPHNDWHQRFADKPAQHQPQRNAHDRQQQRLLANHTANLPRRRADGFEQAIKTHVSRHGNLKDVVDDEVTCEKNEQKHHHNEDDRHRIGIFSDGGAGVAPVDTDVDIVVGSDILTLVAVVGENLVQVRLNVATAAFKHHIHVPDTGVVVVARRRHANFVKHRVDTALRNDYLAGR